MKKRVRYLDLEPDNVRPPLGLAQITVTTDSGKAGSALLRIPPNPGDPLEVRTDPPSITQDAFLDQPVTVTASGLEPLEKVYFNLGLPDTTYGAIGLTEGLHADESGTFTYELQAVSVNSQVGTWVVSIQSGSGFEGSTTFAVEEGAPRTASKTVSFASATIDQSSFATSPGMQFALEGFTPFDAYEVTLTTPNGAGIALGVGRTDGEGKAEDGIIAPAGVPAGQYTLTARSIITGD